MSAILNVYNNQCEASTNIILILSTEITFLKITFRWFVTNVDVRAAQNTFKVHTKIGETTHISRSLVQDSWHEPTVRQSTIKTRNSFRHCCKPTKTISIKTCVTLKQKTLLGPASSKCITSAKQIVYLMLIAAIATMHYQEQQALPCASFSFYMLYITATVR